MIATWKACNGDEQEVQRAPPPRATTRSRPSTAGADKFDVTVTFKAAYPDWTPAVQRTRRVKAESVKDPETFNNGWKTLNNDWLSGPFKVESFDNSQKVLTEVPNDKWWGDKPLLDKITFRAISPDATAAAFANNELDTFDIGPDPDAYKRVQGVSDASIRQAAGPELPALHLQHQGRRADRPEGAAGHRQGPGPRGDRRLRPGRHRLARRSR